MVNVKVLEAIHGATGIPMGRGEAQVDLAMAAKRTENNTRVINGTATNTE